MLPRTKLTTLAFKKVPFNLSRIAIATVVAAAVTVAACDDDDPVRTNPPLVTFTAIMNGAGEVPSNTTTGTGTLSATLDTTTNIFTYDLAFSGLTSNVQNGHIHGPAIAGANADPIVDFRTLTGATFTTGATVGTGHGTILLTSATQVTPTIKGDSLRKLLLAGKTYVNIHTANNTGGEVRGQIIKQ